MEGVIHKPEGRWFDSSTPHSKVSLGKTLNTKLWYVCIVVLYEWVNLACTVKCSDGLIRLEKFYINKVTLFKYINTVNLPL